MQSWNARGTINPCRFVVGDPSQDRSIQQAGANGDTLGVSQEWNHDAPIPGAGTDAAASGESVKVYDLGETCLLELGGTVARFTRLKADTDGKGVAIATTGTTIQQIGAIALQAGSSGDKVQVQVVKYSERPALT